MRVTALLLLGLVAACSDDDKNTSTTDTTVADSSADSSADTAGDNTTSTPDVSVADTHEVSDGACSGRMCGPDPVTHEDCGACPTPGFRACNDGLCEPTCDASACAAMGFTSNTCQASGECDGEPAGAIATTSYTCSSDGTTCDAAASAVDCGVVVTDCTPCDLSGADDGFCSGNVCKAPAETTCTAPTCVDRECGPDPVTHIDCGACSGDTLACNDGKCQATCDATKCSAMGYSENTCVSSGECDGSPSGAHFTYSYSCNGDNTICEAASTALDCGVVVTDCTPCDLDGSDDGLCRDNVCKSPADAACE